MSRPLMVRLIGAVAAVIAAVPAAAQPPVTQTVVVTGQAEDVPLGSLARDVIVLTRDEIERLPGRSVADVLSFATGIDVLSRGPWGVQTDFSLRGATFDQTLVLVDGVRLNDAQSGHHNGDIPVPLDQIDRIEVLLGPGSSVYGADAFGGTINIITRRSGSYKTLTVSGGSNGYVSGSGAIAGTGHGLHESVAVSADRSSGFEVDREFMTFEARSETRWANGVGLQVAALDKHFGANGFYGPAQSVERTNEALVSADGALRTRGWTGQWQGAFRTHGDTYTYDRFTPGIPNRHRDGTVDLTGHAAHALSSSSRLTIGLDAGDDWIRSNNLGDHSVARASGFTELQQQLGAPATIYAGVREDEYSTFGSALSPSLAGVVWLGRFVKLHASTGRAFRVPTFTDRFYSDPANVGNPGLTPERSWGSDTGIDLVAPRGLMVGATVFDRHDRDTIDFVRAAATDRWQAENIRTVIVDGVELSGRRPIGTRAWLGASYTFLDPRTDTLPLLSHYALNVARHSLDLTGTEQAARFTIGERLGHVRRQDGRDYWIADARLARSLARAAIFVDGTNLFDTRYQEVVGVDMPGRSFRVGLTVRP